MLADRFKTKTNPEGWLVSEKFDGWRAMWTGKEFVSRDGNIFPAPQRWLDAMPAVPLDGELWLGRGRFNEVSRAVRCSDWSEIRFVVFDAPACPGRVEARQAFLATLPLPDFCQVAEQTTCTSREHLKSMFDDVVDGGGEGLMLRKPGAVYEPWRSRNLLKLKPKGIE